MKFDLPPLVCLPAFEAAARRKSFTKAAEELCLTQAAISFQVRNLEKALGADLFVRHHRALELTRAGEDLHRAVQRAFTGLAAEKAAITGRKPVSTVTISAPVSLCSKWLVPRLHRLRKGVPGVTLLIDANDTALDLEDGSVDLAIRYSKSRPEAEYCKRLIEDTAFPVCSPAMTAPLGRDLQLGDIGSFALLHDQMLDVTWADWLHAAAVKPESASQNISFSHTGNAIDAAVSGQGLALGRLPLVVDDLASGRLIVPFDVHGASSYAYYLIRPHRSRRSKALDRVVSWLLTEAETTAQALH